MESIFETSERKKTEDFFREKVRGAFEEGFCDVKKYLMGSPLTDALMVQAAIVETRQSLLESSELQILEVMLDWNSQTIIDEECDRVMQKYLRIGGLHKSVV